MHLNKIETGTEQSKGIEKVIAIEEEGSELENSKHFKGQSYEKLTPEMAAALGIFSRKYFGSTTVGLFERKGVHAMFSVYLAAEDYKHLFDQTCHSRCCP